MDHEAEIAPGSQPDDPPRPVLAGPIAELEAMRASEDKYRKAAEHLARQYAETMLQAERDRAALLRDHDAFIVELTEEHDKLIAAMARERDDARELVSEAVHVRDGVAAASKRLVRDRTLARRELGEVALERDIARRDAARATKQLADAREEIARLRRELETMALLNQSVQQRRPSLIPSRPTGTETPPPPTGTLGAALAGLRPRTPEEGK